MNSHRKMAILAFVLIVSSCIIPSISANPDVAPGGGSGTETDPYCGTVQIEGTYSSIKTDYDDTYWLYGSKAIVVVNDGDFMGIDSNTNCSASGYYEIENCWVKFDKNEGSVATIKLSHMMLPSITITFNIIFSIDYNVSYSSDGVVIHTETVETDSTVQPYTPPEREGYTFGGWYTDETFQTPFDFNTPITSDIILYAKWVENPITITFYTEGNVHSTLQVPKGSVGIVYTPIMVTGVFGGWFYDSALTQKYDATKALTKDTDLYALGVPPLVFTSEPTAAATITSIDYGTFFFDATDSMGRYQIHWDFGDGNTSDEAIAYNTYSVPGKYTVTLTITNIYGDSSTAIYYVEYGENAAGGGDNDLRTILLVTVFVIIGGLVIRRIL